MDFAIRFHTTPVLLMEGAMGENLKRRYGLAPHPDVALAGLVREERGREALQELWNGYADVAQRHGFPFLATTPTRRANRDRVARSGLGNGLIAENVALLREVRRRQVARGLPMYIGGLMGCRGDAYRADEVLPEAEAEPFHAWAAERFAEADVDFLYAGIMPALPEATGMARAMAATGLPYILSFMLHRDGCLPDGTRLHDAIDEIDRSVSPQPLCYMTNCIHPYVLAQALDQPFNRTGLVMVRFCGIQANASPLDPALLDAGDDLESSRPQELVEAMLALHERMTLRIVGGCCGTDATHLEAIARRLVSIPAGGE